MENKRNEIWYSRFPQLNPPKPKGQLGTENNREFQRLSCADSSPEQGWWDRRRAEQSPYLTQVSFSSLYPSSQAETREKGREHRIVERGGISHRRFPRQPHLRRPGGPTAPQLHSGNAMRFHGMLGVLWFRQNTAHLNSPPGGFNGAISGLPGRASPEPGTGRAAGNVIPSRASSCPDENSLHTCTASHKIAT